MFWKPVPEDVIGKFAEFTSADFVFMWKVKKDKMEVATEGTWTEREWSPRTLQLREYLLREFWAIFVDDRPLTHSRSMLMFNQKVFSYAITVMDRIFGWIDKEKWVGSKFAAGVWIYTKMVLTEWRKPTPEMQEYLKRRMLSFMLHVNWVCAGTFDDHEWVSETTTVEQEEEVTGRDLDYEICMPCVVQRSMQWRMLWFSTPRRLNQTLEGEGVNIEKKPRSGGHGDCIRDLYAFWRFAHTANVHVDNGGCSFA